MLRRDYRAEPVRRLVVLGESNAFGMNASDPRNEWVQTVANLVRDFQDEPVLVLNNAYPANVIGPASPGYHPDADDYTTRPTALQRYREHVIDERPDLFLMAYGLNDSRCANPVDSFIRDYRRIVHDVRAETSALVVCVGPYWNTQYDLDLWNGLAEKPDFGLFDKAGRDLVVSYVEAIRRVADQEDCLFVDLFTPLESAHWLLSDDQCHFHDLGQRVLGQTVFGVIAANSSFLSRKSLRLARQGDFTIANTGGTNAASGPIHRWHGR
jgi:lysophospholipase L1-like esterase